MTAGEPRHLLVTGGAGYIGSRLVPVLLALGYRVTVFDRLLFGDGGLLPVRDAPHFRLVQGDIRDYDHVDRLLAQDPYAVVIHLAAISNDPSAELDPDVTRAVNDQATTHLMTRAKQRGVARFIYASSASVYGIKETPDVTEDLPLEPITLYAACKARGEEVLHGLVDAQFTGVSVRSATVCGYAPRLRLDLTINILTHQALTQGRLRVFGGSQLRPNIHLLDLVDFYAALLTAPATQINGRAFNVSHENATVFELARMIQAEIDPQLPIDRVPTDDLRSYHLSTRRAREELGFVARRTLPLAVRELKDAYRAGEVPHPEADIYRNVAWMQAHPERWQLSPQAP